MRMNRIRLALAAAAPLTLLAAVAHAQDGAAEAPAKAPASAPAANLPTGSEVIASFIKATGGREAYERLTSRRSVGKVEMAAMGLSGTISIDHAKPNKMKFVMDLGGMGGAEQATDGVDVWSNSAAMGPAISQGDERDQFLQQATFNAELRFDDMYSDITTVGTETVEGKECFKVELTPRRGGSKETRFYDKNTGLLVMVRTVAKTPMGDIPSESILDDWRELDGVKVPHVMRLRQMGQELVVRFEKIEHNVTFADGHFAMPDEVKKLKQETTKNEAPAAPKAEPRTPPDAPKP